MIKCIIFDIGGVIVDFYNDTDYYPYLARISGAPLKRVTKIVDKDIRVDLDKGGISQRAFDREVARQFRIKEKDIMWYELYKKKARLYKGTVEIIRRLKRKYTLAYLSNTDRSRYTYTVERLLKPYLRLFDYRFASCDIGLRKPNKNIYRYALSKMRLRSSEAVFIDNQIENIIGARKAGIKSIWFKTPKTLKRDLEKLGVKV